MKLRRIYGVLLQEWYMTLRSLEIIADVFVFPLINIAVFGLISLYLAGNDQTAAAEYVLLGMLLWQIIWVIGYSVGVGSLWNIWSRNLSNMFVAPLRMSEYILSHFVSGCVKAFFMLLMASLISAMLFDFNILTIGLTTLVMVFVVFALFAFAIALVVLGLIFRYGTRISALSWTVISIFQPLSAAFFPLDVMPKALQVIGSLFPATYGFEAARYALMYHSVEWRLLEIGLALDFVYCILGVLLFRYLFDKSRDIGQFARNEA